MEYLKILFLSMLPVTELRGSIPIGIASGLNPIVNYMVCVVGSTLVAIPLILTFRHVLDFLRKISIFHKLVNKVDRKIDKGKKKLKNLSILGIILFVGVPLPTTGTWTAAAVASIFKMRIRDALIGVLLGNMLAGVIVSTLSLHVI